METSMVQIVFQGSSYEVAISSRKRGPETIWLLHGLGCSKESFHHIWAREELGDYSIFAMDYPGFGDSAKPEDFSYELEDQALIYARTAKEHAPQGPHHIVAHSMGGAIALLMPQDILQAAASFADLEGNLSSTDGGVVSRRTISVPYPEFEQGILPEFKIMAQELGEGRFFLDQALPLAFYKSAGSLVRWTDSGELLERFKRLKCKKRYYYGESNTQTVALERFKGIETQMIAGAGHFLMNDNPGQFYTNLQEFLQNA